MKRILVWFLIFICPLTYGKLFEEAVEKRDNGHVVFYPVTAEDLSVGGFVFSKEDSDWLQTFNYGVNTTYNQEVVQKKFQNQIVSIYRQEACFVRFGQLFKVLNVFQNTVFVEVITPKKGTDCSTGDQVILPVSALSGVRRQPKYVNSPLEYMQIRGDILFKNNEMFFEFFRELKEYEFPEKEYEFSYRANIELKKYKFTDDEGTEITEIAYNIPVKDLSPKFIPKDYSKDYNIVLCNLYAFYCLFKSMYYTGDKKIVDVINRNEYNNGTCLISTGSKFKILGFSKDEQSALVSSRRKEPTGTSCSNEDHFIVSVEDLSRLNPNWF